MDIVKLQKRIMKHLGVWKQFKKNRVTKVGVWEQFKRSPATKGNMLHTSFDWSGSPEGFVFWDNISKQMLEYAMLIDEVRKYDKEIAKYLTKEIFTDASPGTISICGNLNDVVFWEWTGIPSKQWGILATKLDKH